MKSKAKAKAKAPAATGTDPRGTAPSKDEAPKPRASLDEDGPAAEDGVEDEMVTVTVPKAFRLHDGEKENAYDSGIYEMPRSHATHWYSVAHGVEIKK